MPFNYLNMDTLDKISSENCGIDFRSIAQSEVPQEAIDVLISDIAQRYRCDRVYVFEKNAAGTYDCSDEWVNGIVPPRKHLLQKLTPTAVTPYYNHFRKNGKLIVRDFNVFESLDGPLARMLRAQDLSAILVGQLMYDGEDEGFVGIDNPDIEKFDELEALFPLILYVLSIQKHRQEMQKRILDQYHTEMTGITKKKSMYNRAAELKRGDTLGLIYCAAVSSREKENGYGQQIETLVKHVLDSVFEEENVYGIGKDEYLIILEQCSDREFDEIEYYVDMAVKTLEIMNIHLATGVVVTQNYPGGFFDLVNTANAYLQRDVRRYREMYTGKYHLDNNAASAFLDFIEIRPDSNEYHVVYSEHLDSKSGWQGKWSEFYVTLLNTIVESDRNKFSDFWVGRVADYIHTSEHAAPVTETFRFDLKGVTISLDVSILHYRDIHGKSILLCYTT